MDIIKGNIFNTKKDVLVNTVNCAGVMGKGMALECRLRFPEMFKEYKKKCGEGLMSPGVLHLYSHSEPMILNFPTKQHWKDPSKESYIIDGLVQFQKLAKREKIKSIAFPLLGASLGKLNKNKVINIMQSSLSNLSQEIDIEIYDFDPNAADELFDSLYSRIKDFRSHDYKIFVKNSKTQDILYREIKNQSIRSMLGLQNIPGVGSTTIERFHKYIRSEETRHEQKKLDI